LRTVLKPFQLSMRYIVLSNPNAQELLCVAA
jgi:hypothetical protein